MSGLSSIEVERTAAWLASVQLADGMVPWYRGGHADPWNHTEATMALAAGGRWAEVERAFEWLAAHQLPDGSWCTFYLPDGVLEPRRDPNVCAYVATGAWWCSQLGGGTTLLEALWPMIESGISWSLRQQRPGGEIVWSVGPDGVPGNFALLAANSSIQLSLRCAVRIAEVLGYDRRHWSAAAARVAGAVASALPGTGASALPGTGARAVAGTAARAVAGRGAGSATSAWPSTAANGAPSTSADAPPRTGVGAGIEARAGMPLRFAPKERWAMDWYYPVLSGAVTGPDAYRRMRQRWEDMVEPGVGVRCVADKFWVTAAETAECAMAANRVGMRAEAEELLSCTRHLREDNGAYWTGCAHPECVRFPGGQRSTYSAAAVIIADHVLYRRSAAAGIFTSESSLLGPQTAGVRST